MKIPAEDATMEIVATYLKMRAPTFLNLPDLEWDVPIVILVFPSGRRCAMRAELYREAP